jgi:hypothetical protein
MNIVSHVKKAAFMTALVATVTFNLVQAAPMLVSVTDPEGDNTGPVDVIGMDFEFDNETGNYRILLTTSSAEPFMGDFRIDIELFNLDVGTTANDPSFFQDTINDFRLLVPSTALILSGTNSRLLSWGAGDRILLNNLPDGTPHPDGATLFSSVVAARPGQSLEKDVIGLDKETAIVTSMAPAAGSLQFSAPSFSVVESAPSVPITVVRTGGSTGAVSVDYATSDGSATAGSDYSASAGTLSFADGETSQSFSVAILDDTLYEGDEGFGLSLSNVAGGASLGTLATASVTITEDDPPPPAGSLQFSASGFSVAESGGSVAISVTRTGGSAGAVSVDYATSDGSATAGSDYTASGGTLSFADGETSQSFSVAILDDTLSEGDEGFSLTLANVVGGASLGTPATANVTITDDDTPPTQDSNGDGLSDADAIALGLDPNDPDGDTDNDGISDVLEVGSDVNNPPDADIDGVIDALEPGTDAADAMVASGLPLAGGGTLKITTAAGEMLSGVSATAATGGPAGVNFPFGMVSYMTTAPAGGTVSVQMEFSSDLPTNLAMYKVDNAGTYRELAASLWTRVNARRVDLALTDGDPLTDLDGIANASIEDPVAPAEIVPLASSGGGGGGGCVLNSATQDDPMLMLLMLAALIRVSWRAAALRVAAL